MNKKEEEEQHDKILSWAAVFFLITIVIGLSVNANAQSSQQSGTACVNGSQYCENNSLDTVNTTTTTNTNSNTNNNTNTNTSTATNTNNNSNTNVSTNTNTSTNSAALSLKVRGADSESEEDCDSSGIQGPLAALEDAARDQSVCGDVTLAMGRLDITDKLNDALAQNGGLQDVFL